MPHPPNGAREQEQAHHQGGQEDAPRDVPERIPRWPVIVQRRHLDDVECLQETGDGGPIRSGDPLDPGADRPRRLTGEPDSDS